MDLAQAIAAISGSGIDNASQIVSALQSVQQEMSSQAATVTSLTEERDRVVEHNNKLLGQKTAARKEADGLKDKLAKLTASIAEGDGDEEQALERLQNLADELKQTKEKLTTAEQEKEAAISDKTKLEQSLTYQQAAQKLGAKPIVFEKLLELPADRLLIEGDAVKVKGEDDKLLAFDEFLGTQPADVRELVERAISGKPEDNGTETPPRKTGGPTAPPSNPPKTDLASSYLEKAGFGIPKRDSA
jgi:DNA polymerase III alpha subunit (gram-positive type)